MWFPASDPPSLEEARSALSAWDIPAAVRAEREDPSWFTAASEFHRPVEIAGAVRVRPPWVPRDGALLDVVIDPGMAFGSGQHATTRCCLEALCELPRADLLDVGCGSGILAIAGAKLGYGPVRAIDNDPHSIEATERNAAANGVEVVVSGAAAGDAPIAGARVMVANLTATTLCELAERPPDPLPEHAILSGMRDFELDAVYAAWARRGLGPTRLLELDGWCTVVLRR